MSADSLTCYDKDVQSLFSRFTSLTAVHVGKTSGMFFLAKSGVIGYQPLFELKLLKESLDFGQRVS